MNFIALELHLCTQALYFVLTSEADLGNIQDGVLCDNS